MKHDKVFVKKKKTFLLGRVEGYLSEVRLNLPPLPLSCPSTCIRGTHWLLLVLSLYSHMINNTGGRAATCNNAWSCLFFYKKQGLSFLGAGYLKNMFFGNWQGSRFIFYPSKIFSSIVQVSKKISAKIIRQKAVAPFPSLSSRGFKFSYFFLPSGPSVFGKRKDDGAKTTGDGVSGKRSVRGKEK